MPAQMIQIDQKTYALLPKAEYQEMVAAAAGVTLPAMPEPNKRGNYPARAALRAMLARDLIADRLAAGLTQEALAKRAGVSVETISRLEAGKHKPQAATMEKLDRALKRSGR